MKIKKIMLSCAALCFLTAQPALSQHDRHSGSDRHNDDRSVSGSSSTSTVSNGRSTITSTTGRDYRGRNYTAQQETLIDGNGNAITARSYDTDNDDLDEAREEARDDARRRLNDQRVFDQRTVQAGRQDTVGNTGQYSNSDPVRYGVSGRGTATRNAFEQPIRESDLNDY